MAEPMVTHVQQPMGAVQSHANINECNNVCSARWPPVFVFLLIGNTWRYLNPLFTLQYATWVAKNGKQHLVPQKQVCVCASVFPSPALLLYSCLCSIQYWRATLAKCNNNWPITGMFGNNTFIYRTVKDITFNVSFVFSRKALLTAKRVICSCLLMRNICILPILKTTRWTSATVFY